jgi:hypothetical protein
MDKSGLTLQIGVDRVPNGTCDLVNPLPGSACDFMVKEHDITTHIASLDEKSERDRSDGLTRLWINDFEHPVPAAMFNSDNKVRNVRNSIVHG